MLSAEHEQRPAVTGRWRLRLPRSTSSELRKAGDIIVSFEGLFANYVRCTATRLGAELSRRDVLAASDHRPTAELAQALALSRQHGG